jgi:sugar phosphate permease
MDQSIERSALRKIYVRLLPFAVLSYFLAYVDRINVSFAALTMRGDLDMSAAAYGFALGTFYWSYFLFEVPSNIVMEKVGARLWIARIMITWGLLAGATAYHGSHELRGCSLSARCCGGRLLSRPRPLLHLWFPSYITTPGSYRAF